MSKMLSLFKSPSAKKPDSELSTVHYELVETSEIPLADAHFDGKNQNVFRVPVAQLTSLGAGVSSLLPSLRTITQSSILHSEGLYRLSNASVGDVLKKASSGDFWGALNKAGGGSKLARFQQADPVAVTNTTVMPLNPATLMMAAALYSIEQKLDRIEEIEKQILSFLEIEKQAKIEADLKTLAHIMVNYKHSWDNEFFVTNNHKLVLDIKRTASANMLSYEMQVNEGLKSSHLIVGQKKVNSALSDLLCKFKYYRLSIITFSMASQLEVLLSGNFKEEYIQEINRELEQCSLRYRELFSKCSTYLEKMAGIAVEKLALKGLGVTSKTVGKLIGGIPVVKRGPVDEFLQDRGVKLEKAAERIEESIIRSFAEISDPGTQPFTSQMKDMMRIYNHTSDIYFNENQIYLITA